MRVIIAGSRTITNLNSVSHAMRASGFRPTHVLSGCARGVDRLGEQWAHAHGVQVRRFPALWLQNGRRAGLARNVEMAQHADALVAVWDGRSTGTAHMIKTMRSAGKPVFVWSTQS
jgi:YspA, cpYpsA-related SLOG family